LTRIGRLGAVEAIVVDTIKRGPGQMAGIGDAGLLDTLTEGQYTVVQDKLDSISLGLKLSIAASVLSGALATIALFAYASRGAPRGGF
jgi:hypothetical protein